MSEGQWSFVSQETGDFTGQTFSGPSKWLAANTPGGTKAVVGLLEMPRTLPTAEDIKNQIAAIEAEQPRAVRDALLAVSAAEVAAAHARLQDIELRIQSLRRARHSKSSA